MNRCDDDSDYHRRHCRFRRLLRLHSDMAEIWKRTPPGRRADMRVVTATVRSVTLRIVVIGNVYWSTKPISGCTLRMSTLIVMVKITLIRR